MWSSVGSAGIVDVADIGKVVFGGSVAQLGHGIGGVHSGTVNLARVVTLPQVAATLRYGVTPAGVDGTELGVWSLQMRYRSGNGRVIATLIEVDLGAAIVPPLLGPAVERPLLTVESSVPSGDQFVTYFVNATGSRHALDFGNHAYYIAVSLIGEEIVLGSPPAISSIALLPFSGI